MANIDDLDPIISEMINGNDRASALVGAATAEHYLQEAITSFIAVKEEKFLKEVLYTHSGPFGAFSFKIIGAYAIGLIGPITFRDLNLIRKIRNEFAHDPNPVSFDAHHVAQRVGQISWIAEWRKSGVSPDSPKLEFVRGVAVISGLLLQHSKSPSRPFSPVLR